MVTGHRHQQPRRNHPGPRHKSAIVRKYLPPPGLELVLGQNASHSINSLPPPFVQWPFLRPEPGRYLKDGTGRQKRRTTSLERGCAV
ncbi:hypothetical protein CSOJ01_04840 [Colletotrichum sojae]|uniref:Uncharacterized protein n=1 Tax=Colletotrichum sojae TaxID=2175907 RepID=A0A8H6JHD0_9PEZI|nr:hypothetical protein CSOJ01_04840 [Colletotrichum sojae]